MNQSFSAVLPTIISFGRIAADSILHVPDTPGAGLDIDSRIFAQGMEGREGFRVVI